MHTDCSSSQESLSLIDPIERFSLGPSGRVITRSIQRRSGGKSHTRVSLDDRVPASVDEDGLAALFDQATLRSRDIPKSFGKGANVRSVDLFSGAGLLSLGAMQACHALGIGFDPILAIDAAPIAARAYAANFPTCNVVSGDIVELIDGRLGTEHSESESQLRKQLGRIDLLLGGPPCQGHSDLNNHTRRDDPKNRLYDRMARFAEIVRPTNIVIENVPAVRHDRRGVVGVVVDHLQELGYRTFSGVVRLADLGVPQSRSRHVVVASLTSGAAIADCLQSMRRPWRSTTWAIGDLKSVPRTDIYDTASVPTVKNRNRIDYLFSNRTYDLPDRFRPDCHKLKAHSYRSMYGRLKPNEPAQTITSGYGSMGQGRFVHPTQRRMITPHEAARLQLIPDSFNLRHIEKRTALAEVIGNAVPPKLAYVLALDLLR